MKTKAEINQLANSLKSTVEAAIQESTDTVLNAKEVAEMLGISIGAVRVRCYRKQLPYRKKHNRLYFSKNAITKYYLSN